LELALGCLPFAGGKLMVNIDTPDIPVTAPWLHPSHRVSLAKALLILAIIAIGALLLSNLPLQPFIAHVGFHALHTIIETISVVIAILIFSIGWHAHHKSGLPINYLVLGCAFLSAGILDISHMLSFSGMPLFVTPSDPQKGIAFWLPARFLVASSLLLFVIQPWRAKSTNTLRYSLLTAVMSLMLMLHWLILFHMDWLPSMFIPGQGLTTFKIGSEWIIIAINVITAALLLARMRNAQTYDTAGLFGAVCAMATSEFFFSTYSHVDDVYIILGHYFKIASYAFLYRAIFIAAIDYPYKKLRDSQNRLQATLDAMPDLILDVDMDGCCYECHTASPILLASLPEGHDIMNMRDILPQPALEIGFSALREAQQYGSSKGKQLEVTLDDGKHWFELSVSSKPVPTGQISHYIVVARDITQRKQTELELQTLNVELEKRRSEERRVGKECRRLCRSRWSPYH
jgi:PAS domain-containing protein